MSIGRDRPREPAQEFLPHFRQTTADPVLPPGQAGVQIVVAALEASPGRRQWPLRGSFRVPCEFAGAEPESILQRLVVSLRSGATHDIQARHAFRQELVFPDDVRQQGQFVFGAFHLDLLRTFDFIAPEDTYFITASVGGYVSDVIACSARMPWLAPVPPDASVEASENADDDDDVVEDDEDDSDTSWMIDDPVQV